MAVASIPWGMAIRSKYGAFIALGLLATAHCSGSSDSPGQEDAGVPIDGAASDGSVAPGMDAASDDASTGDASTGDAQTMDAHVADASDGAASDAQSDAASGASIGSFTAVPTACNGSSIDLNYVFSGGTGLIMPGSIPVAAGTGHVTVTLAGTTNYTLTVSGDAGAPATANAAVTASASPDGTITGPLTARRGETALTASVPTQASVTYAWSVLSANATITAGAATHQATFDVTAGGAEVTLQVVVTSTVDSCPTTSVAHIAMPCSDPTLISLDRSVTPATPQYVPSNFNTRAFDMNASGDIWAPYDVHKVGSPYAEFDLGFSHSASGVWGAPASSPLLLTGGTSWIRDFKVATDTAGDAVFVWTETADGGNVWTAQMRAYRASDNSWTATNLLASDVIDQGTPVSVHLNKATGVALLSWTQGPYPTAIPHLLTYDVGLATFGTNTTLLTAAASNIDPDSLDFDVQTNDALTGFAAWFQKDPATSFYALYARHITSGVPDAAGAVKLAQGTNTFITDFMNYNTVTAQVAQRQVRTIAVSANGNAAVMWKAYNGNATTNKAQLYALRYTGGTWAMTPELVDNQPTSSWDYFDWGIDDAGNMTAVLLGQADYGFTHALAGGAWASHTSLKTVSGFSSLPYLALDSVSGRAIATYLDQSSGRSALKGVFYDPTSHALGPAFTIDDPTQSFSLSGRVMIDGTGKATIAYIQMPTTPPVGSTSATNALEYVVTCK